VNAERTIRGATSQRDLTGGPAKARFFVFQIAHFADENHIFE
jgi:hypothetical protein